MTDTEQNSELYPIRVVSRLTGLSSHTIRMWERRYGAVTPSRSEGNTRQYSREDVSRLLQLQRATSRGYRIREAAKLSAEELQALLDEESSGLAEQELGMEDNLVSLRTDYLEAVSRFEGRQSADILTRTAALLKPYTLVFDVVLPILRETGSRWEAGTFTVAHEHLVTFQMRGMLDTMMRLTHTQAGAPKMVVATPLGHLHEFGVLVGALIAAMHGIEPIYLGQDVPEKDLTVCLQTSSANVVLLGVIRTMSSAELKVFNAMLKRITEIAEPWVGLPSEHAANGAVAGVRYFDNFEAYDLALTGRAGGHG